MDNKENKSNIKGPGGNFGPGRGAPVKKAKEFKKTFKRLIGYIGNYNKLILFVIVILIISTVLSVISPKILGKATTEIGNNIMQKMVYNNINEFMDKIPSQIKDKIPKDATVQDLIDLNIIPENVKSKIPDSTKSMSIYNEPKINFEYIGKIILLILGLYVISSILTFISTRIMANISQKITFKLRKEVDEKLDKLPLRFFDKNTHGDVLSRITNDIDNISTMLQQSFVQILQSFFTIVGIFIMMLTISFSMSGVAILILPASIIFIVVIMKSSQKYFVSNQKKLGEMNSHIEETYSGDIIVKAFNMQEEEIKKFESINNNLYTAGYKSQFFSALMMPIITVINNLGYIGICILGAKLAIEGIIKIGDIQAFIQYTNQFTQPLAQTANMSNMIQGTVASAERVFEILDETEETKDKENAKKLSEVKGNVIFEEVTFSYEDNVELIKDWSLEVKAGKTVAIVGHTGAGKTTIVNLLMRFYDILSGDIKIDDVSIYNMKRSELRSIFSMVLQDTWLFNGTIRENIKYSNQEATDQEILEVAKLSHVDHFIDTLDNRYDFVLNEEADNISSGQKQLLTIARAMLSKSPILILDEATSNVDTRTEGLIQKAMKQLMKNKTCFVIAHRLSTIRNADIIIYMEKGKIVEKGTHEELLNLNNKYAKLYNSQFVEG